MQGQKRLFDVAWTNIQILTTEIDSVKIFHLSCGLKDTKCQIVFNTNAIVGQNMQKLKLKDFKHVWKSLENLSHSFVKNISRFISKLTN